MAAIQDSSTHPVDDGLGDYIVDPASAVNMVSMLLQLVLALVGPDKAKAALDWETVQAARARADSSKAASDVAALKILHERGLF